MQAVHRKMQGTSPAQRLRLQLVAAEYVERIGQRIRERREELGLSRPALVRKTQGLVTENDLYRWETGRHRPQDGALDDLAAALEVDTSYFFQRDKPPSKATQIDAIEQRLAEQQVQIEALMNAIGRLEQRLGVTPPATPGGQDLLLEVDAMADEIERPTPPAPVQSTREARRSQRKRDA